MTLALFGHPFSSYTWKVLIPLWMNETSFEFRMLDGQHGENMVELEGYWPFRQFPLLLDDGDPVVEASVIIEHLQAHHPGPNVWIPDGEQGRRVRFLDRIFDLYVMDSMTVPVFDALRPSEERNPSDVARARQPLTMTYDWLEQQLPADDWAVGERFTLADCAAAPALFYADWIEEIGPGRPRLKAYRERLLAHPAVSRAVDEARPYRSLFPLGAPDRD